MKPNRVATRTDLRYIRIIIEFSSLLCFIGGRYRIRSGLIWKIKPIYRFFEAFGPENVHGTDSITYINKGGKPKNP